VLVNPTVRRKKMHSYIILIGSLALASFGVIAAMRVHSSGKKRTGETIGALSLLVLLIGTRVSFAAERESAGDKLGAALVLLEDRIMEGDKRGALAITDRGVRLFASGHLPFDRATREFWDYAIDVTKKSADPGGLCSPGAKRSGDAQARGGPAAKGQSSKD
jgi:hypothetical protein